MIHSLYLMNCWKSRPNSAYSRKTPSERPKSELVLYLCVLRISLLLSNKTSEAAAFLIK